MKCSWVIGDTDRKSESQNDLGLKCAKSLNKLLDWKQELNFLELEFKAEAEEILLKMDNFLVNNKLCGESLNCKGLQRKHKVVEKNLVGLKYEEMRAYKKESFGKVKNKEMNNKFENTESFQKRKNCEINSKKLTQNILDTCEIVDKSVQTAKELNEKFETINTTSNKVNKSEHLNLKKGINKNKNEVDFYYDTEKHLLIKKQNNLCNKPINEIVTERNLFLDLIDCRKPFKSKSHLQVQVLPSIHLKGGFQIQKINNLEILPEITHTFSLKPSISVDVLSYDALKKSSNLEEVKDFTVPENNAARCLNCGNLVRVHWDINPREIDKFLVKCNFNIFDPRIDEFVYKLIKNKKSIKSCSKCSAGIEDTTMRSKIVAKKKKKFKKGYCYKTLKKKKNFTCERKKSNINMSGLSISESNLKQSAEKLLKKYGEKAKSLEDHYWELESILHTLMSRVFERRIFDTSCFSNFGEGKGKPDLKKPWTFSFLKVNKTDKKPFVFLNEVNAKILPAVKKSGINRNKRKYTIKDSNKLKRPFHKYNKNLGSCDKKNSYPYVGSKFDRIFIEKKSEVKERHNLEKTVEKNIKIKSDESDFEDEFCNFFPTCQ